MHISHLITGKHRSKGVTRLVKLFRDEAYDIYKEEIQKNKLGGDGSIVQIDEGQFGRAKYNRGRALKRDEATLFPIIIDNIDPKSEIHSDQFKSYINLGANIKHKTVNHSTNFVDKKSGAHTQGIESIWNSSKKFIKKREVRDRKDNKPTLGEYCFRKNPAPTFQDCHRMNLIKKEVIQNE